jgi:hypothetical protein
MGVSLSDGDPLQSLAYEVDPEAIVFRSQIGTEIAGKKVVLVGQVSSSMERETREKKPFIIATLALLDGEIDVFVWENLLPKTDGLWDVGTLVTVVGSVRARDDRVSISCTDATRYVVPDPDNPAADQEEEAKTPARPEPPAAVVGDEGGVAGSQTQHGVREIAPSPDGAGNDGSIDLPRLATSGEPRQLRLRIKETERPAEDRRVLDDIRRLLLEYRGDDEVSLEIQVDGRIVMLEWPAVKVHICAELRSGLHEILGPSGAISVGFGAVENSV